MATKSTPKRIPRYVDEEGLYLDILEGKFGFQIGWYIPDEGEFGLVIDNDPTIDKDNLLVVQTLIDFCESNGLEVPSLHKEFVFETKAQAVKALRAVNAKLYYRKQELPEWAKRALAAGWSPPKEWKP